MTRAAGTARVFGPVPSRRLGRSLGLDLLPVKTCTLDCLYCQVGRTTCRTVERRSWVPWEPVLEELRSRLDARPDIVTFSGSGEPTLHAELGRAIADVKAAAAIPVAVITNGTLLFRPEVRREILAADVVIPSLDAGDEETFRRVNRPDPGLSFEAVVEGLESFAREYPGTLLLEVFLLRGLNDGPDQIEKIARAARRIAPHRIQLNTVARPPADRSVRPSTPAALEAAAKALGGSAEIIADFADREEGDRPPGDEEVLALLRRRPCTVEDLANGLGSSRAGVMRSLAALTASGRAAPEIAAGRTYYVAAEGREEGRERPQSGE